MKKLVLIISLLVPVMLFAGADDKPKTTIDTPQKAGIKIKDPVKYFLNTYGKDVDDDKVLLKTEFDINNDGVKELFLTYSKKRDYEYIWTVFLNKGDYWAEAKSRDYNGAILPFSAISFHQKFAYVGFMDKKRSDYGLLSKGHSGVYSKVYLKDDILIEKYFARDSLPERTVKYYDKLVNHFNIKVEELEFDELVENNHLIKRWLKKPVDKIKDPVKYFLNKYEPFGGDTNLLKAEIDLNNDGVKELLLSYSMLSYNEDNWAVFINKGNYWIKAKYRDRYNTVLSYNNIHFDEENCYIGFIDKEKNDYALLTKSYLDSFYYKIYMRDDIIFEKKVEESELSPKIVKHYKELIKSGNIKIEKLKFEECKINEHTVKRWLKSAKE